MEQDDDVDDGEESDVGDFCHEIRKHKVFCLFISMFLVFHR